MNALLNENTRAFYSPRNYLLYLEEHKAVQFIICSDRSVRKSPCVLRVVVARLRPEGSVAGLRGALIVLSCL